MTVLIDVGLLPLGTAVNEAILENSHGYNCLFDNDNLRPAKINGKRSSYIILKQNTFKNYGQF